MSQLIFGKVITQLVGTFVELRIPDNMSTESFTPVEGLASSCGANADALNLILRALSVAGVVEEAPSGKSFKLTRCGAAG